MNLDAVVGVLVAIFRRKAFCHGGEGVGKFLVIFEFLAFVGCERTLTGYVFEHLVEVDIAGALVEKRAGSVELGFHHGKHFRHSREFDDSLAKLTAVLSICKSLAVGDFTYADALCGDAEAGAVHKSHYIFDKAHACVANEFGGSVLIDELACGRAFDTHFVLDATDVDAAVTLVVDKHREAAAIGGAFFGTGKHKVDVGVAVGDETLHAVEHPRAVFFLSGFEHYRLEVGTGIGLGKVHRHGLAFAYAGDETRALVVVAEFIKGFGAILKTPEVFKTGIGAAHDVGSHDIGGDGEIETTETAGHSHTHQTGLAAKVEVYLCAGGISHAAIVYGGAVMVDRLSVFGNSCAAYFAHDFEHALIVVHSVLKIERSVIEFVGVGEVAFFEFNNLAHHRMFQMMSQVGIVCIEISHGGVYLEFFL